MKEEHLKLWPLVELVHTEEIFGNIFTLIDESKKIPNENKPELKETLGYLFELGSPYFLAGKDKNPIHHNVQVVENILQIVLGENQNYSFVRKAAILALLHDIGNGVVDPSLKKIKDSDIENKLAELEELGKTRAEIIAEMVKFIEGASKFRKAHMEEGEILTSALLRVFNESCNNLPPVSDKDIDEIAGIIRVHDAPSVAEYYKKAGITFEKDDMIPLDKELAVILREADRMFMVSKSGLEKDLFDDLKNKKDEQPDPLKKLAHNIGRFKEEYQLYADASTSGIYTPEEIKDFKGKTLFRTESGFQLLTKNIHERLKEILKIDECKINIAASIGGTKLSTALVFPKGTFLEVTGPLEWRSAYNLDDSEASADKLKDKIVENIEVAIMYVKQCLDLDDIGKIGISCKGPLDVVDGEKTLGKDKKLTTLPFKDYTLETEVKTALDEKYNRSFNVDLIHDGVAAVLGETAPGGSLAGERNASAIIIGTGIGIGIIENGRIGYEKLGSLGRYLVWVEVPPYRSKYEFEADENGNPIREKKDLNKHYEGKIVKHFSERIAGPWLAKRIASEMLTDKEFFNEINTTADKKFSRDDIEKFAEPKSEDKNLEKELLIRLTKAAKDSKSKARSFVDKVADEIGCALAELIYEYREKEFVKHIVLVSSVAENIGKNIEAGTDVFMEQVRQRVAEQLHTKSLDIERACAIAKGIIRSKISYEREYLAFTPK